MNLKKFIHNRFYSKMADLDLELRDRLTQVFNEFKSSCPWIEFPDVTESDDLGSEVLNSFIKKYKDDKRVPMDLITKLSDLKTEYHA